MNRKNMISGFGKRLLLLVILSLFLLYLVYDFETPFFPQFFATLVVTGFTALPAFFSVKVLLDRKSVV